MKSETMPKDGCPLNSRQKPSSPFAWAPPLLSATLCVVGILPAASNELYRCVIPEINGVLFGCCIVGGFFPYFALLTFFRGVGDGRKAFLLRSFLLGWSHRIHTMMYCACACFQLLYVAWAAVYLNQLLRSCTSALAYVEAVLILFTLLLILPQVAWKWVTFARNAFALERVYRAMSGKFGVDAESSVTVVAPASEH